MHIYLVITQHAKSKDRPEENMLLEPLWYSMFVISGRVAQTVTCLATDVCLTADPGVASLIPARSHTFVEIDHEIIPPFR